MTRIIGLSGDLFHCKLDPMVKNLVSIDNKEQIFLTGYKNLTVKRAGVLTCPWPKLGLRFEVDDEIASLFPYINGSFPDAKYFDSPERIQFVFEGIQCTLYSTEIIAAAFNDYDHALLFSENLISFLNNLSRNRTSVKPDFKKITPLAPLDVYKLLPRTNCRECGFDSCLAFAAAISQGRANSSDCPGFSEPITHKAVYPVLDREGNLSSTIELSLPLQVTEQKKNTVVEGLLTEREQQVIQLMARGASNQQISETLDISRNTVKTHVTHIYDKLGVNDRAQAAVWASRHNII